MQVSRAAVCARSSFVRVQAFSSCPVVRVSTCARVRVNSACRSAAQPRQRPSRFVGARSELSDSLKETAALDELIDKLLSAKSQQQVRVRQKGSVAPRFLPAASATTHRLLHRRSVGKPGLGSAESDRGERPGECVPAGFARVGDRPLHEQHPRTQRPQTHTHAARRLHPASFLFTPFTPATLTLCSNHHLLTASPRRFPTTTTTTTTTTTCRCPSPHLHSPHVFIFCFPQLAQLVAENVVAVDTKFWMRIATRNDTAASKEDKDKLQVRGGLGTRGRVGMGRRGGEGGR